MTKDKHLTADNMREKRKKRSKDNYQAKDNHHIYHLHVLRKMGGKKKQKTNQ